MIYREAFPEHLNRVAWMEFDGDRYYNTEFIGKIEEC